jgi:hypothetical protein
MLGSDEDEPLPGPPETGVLHLEVQVKATASLFAPCGTSPAQPDCWLEPPAGKTECTGMHTGSGATHTLYP